MQTTHTIKALIAAAFFATSLGVVAPAYAINAQSDTVTVKIDLRDLETDRGIANVYKTLERRAEAACDSPGFRGLAMLSAEKSCTQSLLADFIADVDHAGLTAYYKVMQTRAA